MATGAKKPGGGGAGTFGRTQPAKPSGGGRGTLGDAVKGDRSSVGGQYVSNTRPAPTKPGGGGGGGGGGGSGKGG